jgi:ribonucleoside-diphosphate reductase alpha chain
MILNAFFAVIFYIGANLMSTLNLADNTMHVLQGRYLNKNDKGEIVETPEELFRRVANHVASCEEDVDKWSNKFYDLMTENYFLPNSPTLMNAGLPHKGSLSACFVIPIDDTMEDIMDAARATALVQKYGGGTGFSFSRLRGRDTRIGSTHGVAAGPVSVLHHFDDVSRLVTQGGKRDGANMGILRFDHPDILNFIHAKDNANDDGALKNFNISVGVTDFFFECVEKDLEYELVDPHYGLTGTLVKARDVFDELVESAWKTGDPGLIFLDNINRGKANPVPGLGPIDATNPCGEQPLYDWDACTLGSLNLESFIDGNDFDYNLINEKTYLAVRFLDDVLEVNTYPLPQIEARVKSLRRIGLGVMGWANSLFRFGIM